MPTRTLIASGLAAALIAIIAWASAHAQNVGISDGAGGITLGPIPTPTGSTLGGVTAAACPANQWSTGINSSGTISCVQPTLSSISGVTVAGQIGIATGVSVTPGTLSLGTSTKTVTGITGLPANAVCWVSYQSGQAIVVGLVIAGCRASGAGQADIIFSTPIAIGISAGTITVNIAWVA